MAHRPPSPTAELDATGRRWRGVLAVALLILGLASLPWLVFPGYRPHVDASIYVATTRSLLAGDGYTYLGEGFIQRPPGLSLLLAAVLAVAPADFWVWNLFTSLWGLAGVLLLYRYALPQLGPPLAAACGAALWFNPTYQRLCNTTLSDVPGFALLLLCLLVERWARRKPWPRDGVLALCVGLSSLLRTFNALVIPAALLARLLDRESRSKPAALAGQGLLLVGIVALVQLPWLRWCAQQAPTVPAEQTRIYTYGTSLLHTDPADPASPRVGVLELLGRIPQRARDIVPFLGSRMTSTGPVALAWVMGGALLILWALQLAVRRQTGDLLAAIMLAALLLWRHYQDRLSMPLCVLASLAALAAIRRWLPWPARVGRRSILLASVVVVVALFDADPRGGWPTAEAQHKEYQQLSSWVEDQFPGKSPLAAAHGWHLAAYLQRPVYSLRMVLGRERRGLPRALQLLDEQRIAAVLLEEDDRGTRSLRRHLEQTTPPPQRHGRWLLFTLAAAPPPASTPPN